MEIIAVANQKGGVGKTTTSVNLAACLAREGRNVLIVDLDAQCNATQHLGAADIDREAGKTSFELLAVDRPVTRSVLTPVGPNLTLIPGHVALAEVDVLLSNQISRELRLRAALNQVDDYDYAILDCPPNLSWVTINALCAADILLVTVETSWFAYDAITRLLLSASKVVRLINPELQVVILPTMHRGHININREVLQRIRDKFGEIALKTVIRHTVAFQEAAAGSQTIIEYGHGSRGHLDYQALAKEIVSRAQEETDIATGTNSGADQSLR